MSRFSGKPGAFAMMEEEARRSGADLGAKVHANMQRVKVHCLTDDGHWDDLGTGHVTIDNIEGSREIALAVVDEKDSGTLLLHKITSDDIYKKQDTIILWKDPEKAREIALSFQEAEGCTHIWENMLSVQKQLKSGSLGFIPYPTFQTPEPEVSSGSDESIASDELKGLPPLELSSLPLLLKTVLEWGAKDQLRVAELISQDHEFFPKLVELFKMCEGSRKIDDLHMIFRLTKEIILLNNVKIFDKIFSDEFILDIIGALEYDPEVPNAQGHRAFVQKHVIFKEAVPIENASVASKIHQTYRILYIKDIIFLRALDDATTKNLNAIIDENNVLVASLLKDDASFFQDLFVRMRSSNISAESKIKLAPFLLDFCIISKSLKCDQQLQLCRDLINEGVVDIISDMLQSQDTVLVSAGTNILMHFLHQDPNLVIKFIAHHEENYQEGNSLLGILVQGIVTDSCEGMHYQSFLRTLLGSSNPAVATECKEVEEVIQFFVDKHLHKLIDVIPLCCAPKGIGRSTSAKPETLLYICEILSFCVLHHPNRVKLNFFATNTMEKILTLTHRKEKVLVVAAVQFMRIIIGRKDEFLNSHIIKLNLLKPIIEVFVENGNRDNMLCSVVLGLLEYIRKENLVSLVKYVAESFWDKLVKFELLGSIQAFRPKHQEIVESAKTKQSASVVDTRKKPDERGAYKEGEHYFNKYSDGEDSATPSKYAQKQSIPARHKSDGLSDCDDNNDYNPPLRKPVKADEDDGVVIPMVKSRLDDVSTYGEAGRKPKQRFKIRTAKTVASASVMGRHADLEEMEVALSSSSTESSEGSGDSQNQQHAT